MTAYSGDIVVKMFGVKPHSIASGAGAGAGISVASDTWRVVATTISSVTIKIVVKSH